MNYYEEKIKEHSAKEQQAKLYGNPKAEANHKASKEHYIELNNAERFKN